MEDEIAKLVEAVSSPASPIDLEQRFRCATVKAGLEKFYLILKFGLELTGDGKLRFQSWERSQVQAVVSVASAIASASRCISADQVEATVVSVLQQLLEFALSYLEKSEYSGDDLSIQNDIVRLLEIGLVNSSNKDTDFVGVSAGNALVDLLPTSSVCSHKIELHVGRDAEGGNYPGEAEPLDKLLTTLTLESLQYGSVGSAPSSYRDLGNTVSLLQHCIIIRFGGIQRLLLICKEIVEFQTVLDEKSVCVNFFKRLTLSLRILKLLRELVEDIPCANHDMPLLQAVSLCAEALPSLFTYETEFLYAPVAADSSYENVGLLVLEEFLHNVRTIFCNSFVFQNIQAFIVASMLDNLGSSVWRYNMSDTTLKAPLVYFPRVVMYMLKLIENVKRQKYQALDWTDLELEHARSHDNQTIFLSRTFHSEKVAFLKKYTSQELMQIMFSPSVSWVDNLMHLASFLHSEAAKLRLKLDRSHSCCAKPGCISEQETTETHEDDALFGDLFSEGGRSVGSTDGRDQPSAASSFSSSVLNQAALEVLTFMKTSIFTPEWHISIYKDGCEQLSCNHVDVLLSVIKCQSCFSDDRVIDRSEFSNGHLKVGNTHEVCFELLHDVLARHALSQALEEYLIERILYVDNGMFVYNNLTLTLLAHTLISKAGASGSQLRTKIYREYIDFIIGKVKSICTQCPSLTELLLTLPSAFHIEIILVAFHLSSESEKTMLANLIFSTFRTIDALGKDCSNTQLSCWALVVSRLILVFRHMICYPSACPSLLLRDLQARIREAPHSSGSNDNFYFWAPTVVESALGLWMKEDPKIINLLSQLLDFSGFPISFSKYDSSIERLCLSRNDICSFFSRTLGYWNAKKATMVEDLIIERYIFALCWDIPSIAHKFSFWRGPWTVEISDMENIFLHSLLNFFSDASLNTNSPQILDRLLRILSSVHIPDNMEELGWHFMRSGIWLSLVLSLFHAGIMGYSIKNAVPGVGSVWMEKTSWDTEYLTFAENLVTSFFRDGQVAMLFRTLSFLLDRYLQVYQKAFLSTMSENEHCTVRNVGVLHLLLLTHTECEKYVQDELLEKSCCSHSHLESICNLLPELNAIVDKKSSGIVTKIYHECILHGFPCYNRTSSATLVSCILVIKQIVSVLEILVKVQDAIELCSPEIQVLCQFLDSVMTIKSDRIFWCLHEKCESVYGSLTSGVDGAGYRNLFLLKQMEEFLRDSNSREAGGGQISEWIVTKAIDTMDSLRKNPSKVIIFKFYLCAEDVSEHVNGLYGLQRCDLVILIDLLDSCFSESVNVKVLNFFVDLISGEISPPLIQKIQQKFCDMNFSSLLKWLERRLLGYSTETVDGIACAEGSSTSLKESTMDFIACITSRGSQCHLKILHNHLFEGMLLLLDTAFISYDIHTAKSYFQFVVQLSKEEALMRALLERTLLLMEKLSRNERLLQGLKFLFGFLVSVLSDSVSIRSTTKRPSGKSLSSSGFGVGSMAFRMLHLGKSAEDLLVSANQKEGATSLECDAISADEDEDDATSDGEVASLDKNEEEDAKGESALASKVCTFTSSGSNFMEQHWYFCYTCDLTLSKGCCSVCAKVCHRGHRVVYSRSSRFFCDCGAGGVRGTSCQCLKPRKLNESSSAPLRNASNVQSLLSITEDGSQSPNSDSDIDDDVADKSLDFSVPSEIQDKFPLLLKEVDIEGQVLGLCSSLIPFIISRRDSNLLKDKEVALGQDKVISYSADLLQLKKAYKSGSLDMKMKADYTNSKELKSLLAGGSLVKSLLSVSNRGRLAVGEGDKVTIFDIGQLIGQATIGPVTADKANVKPLSKNVVRFEIVHIVFNPIVESYLSVAGYEDCQVLTVSSRGEVTDRLGIELALQGAYIRRIDWVPGSQVQLMVVTNRFIKVYDLSQDNISPLHYFTLPDEMIVDATLLLASRWRMFLVVLSESGSLFRLELSVEGNVGAKPLKDVLQIRDRDIHGKGLSLYFSTTYKLLFLSYQDGSTLVGRLNSDATSFCGISAVYENEQDGKLRPAGLHHWRELLIGSGLFFCFSNAKSNAAISVGLHELFAQNLRHAASSASLLVGVTAYKPLSEDKFHCLALHDDGSLQIYIYVPSGVDGGSATVSDKVKKLGPNILNNKAYAVTNPEFPLDFFEKTICITADVKLGGDAVQNGDSEGAKQNLASEEGYLESPGPAGFKISVSNPNPDIVMVGFRIHVGNTSPNHIPSDISIFQRVIRLDEGIRSWYDIPFTVAESLLADEEFTISVGPPCNSTLLSRIDSLEVYGRAKDEFGWKEKLNAVLDMEARALGLSSCDAGSGKKYCSLQATTIQEQVIADGLKLLSVFYSLCGSLDYYKLEVVKSELSKLKCKQLLEMIFESEREPLLQAAACRVLHAICPRREIYHQIKDTMRLLGVVKSTSIISSRFGFGGAMGGWVIEEFTAQMRVVSKIALLRRANLATFLEMHGSQVVDGLMHVLWGLLDIEQPDIHTTKNIVISSVELMYCYAECLALHGKNVGEHSVAPAVELLKKLLFSSNEAVQTSASLAMSSKLLQVPFPKQTMLASDDVMESDRPVNVSGGNTQVMIEEDSITSSVQYCCDGCSTVPILRRRWHCTVCPDFDLCETCYELLHADGLPPPHSKDHPMSAISIEIEPLGGSGNDVHFISEDMTSSSSVCSRSDGGVANATPVHVLESNKNGDFSAPIFDPVSISASKRAVNSLLLSELLEQLSGWMDKTSGVGAIPVMQLFYRLSSATSGPFMDSSRHEGLGLEKLIKWFLDEINLRKPFGAHVRSSFGEVAILVFMFFTLMLRNWHQPGTDSSISKSCGTTGTPDKSVHISSSISGVAPSSFDVQEKHDFESQLIQACNSLRQQAFINYLMDILQQLVHVFKSHIVRSETAQASGCGALLTVRRELPAGNFSPFFSDSYTKSHRSDIFMDYHRLLLETVFRLAYSLVRPEKQDKSGEKEKTYRTSLGKDLKLDGYQDVLCSYINNPNTAFVRRYARRLFLHLCGSKTQYYNVRDNWQFSTEAKKFYKHVNKSGGFMSPASYERSVKIMRCLSTMVEVASARPRNWQKFCLRHRDVFLFMMNLVFYLGEESIIQTLKLLNLAFYTGKDLVHSSQKAETGDGGTSSNKSSSQNVGLKKKKKGGDENDSSLEMAYLDMESILDIFMDNDHEVLRHFIDFFLLEWSSSSVRVEAKCVLYGVWHHGKQASKEIMMTVLLQKVKCLPVYGQNIIEYTELVSLLLGSILDISSTQQRTEIMDKCLTPDVINCIYDTIHSQNEFLANHPNSRIYNILNSLVEFDGYYLESEPCVACSSPEVPYSRMKLENLKSETKFTDNRIIVKCTGSYTIESVTMTVHDARKPKSVKVLNLYYNNRPVADLSELKNSWSMWKRAKNCHLALNQTELKVVFPIAITACNIMIELDSFYENLQALSLEPLQCPRCSRPVTDKHGICSNCHENAYQCRQCRNINYENLDSFLCNECGYSKYGRFEFNFMAKPSFAFDDMESDDDMRKGLAAIESESESAHRRYQQLLGFKKPLLKIVSSIGENEMDSQQKDSVQQMMVSLPGPSCKVNRKIALLGVLYGEKCKAAFDSVSRSIQTLQGLRRVLMNYLHKKNSDNVVSSSRILVSKEPTNCYGCAATLVTQCLEILQVLAKHQNSKKQLVAAGILSELFENNIHQGLRAGRVQARFVLCAFSEGDITAVTELNSLIQKKVMYCLEHHRSMDIALATREELLLLSELCTLADEYWESRLRIVFQLLFSSIKIGAKHPAICEHVILPCLRIISHACTPPKPDAVDKDQGLGNFPSATSYIKDDNNLNQSGALSSLVTGSKSAAESTEKSSDGFQKTGDIQLISYSEWENGASYLDFVRRHYKVSQVLKGASQGIQSQRFDYLALKYALRWRSRVGKKRKSKLFELGSWVTELVLSACSQSTRSEICMLITLLCARSSSRRCRLLNLLMTLLPATLSAGESATEYFELLFKMIDSEDARLFLTLQGCLATVCKLVAQEVGNIEALERSLDLNISQGFVLHKLIELLGKFLEVPNIRSRFMRDNLLPEVLEALIVIRGLIVQKTKLISDCNRLLRDLLDSLLLESSENKRQFIRACISGLQIYGEERKGRACLFILEQLCNLICPSKPEPVYLLVLNKVHTQEEFIRGSMTKNPYSSSEIGPLMRDVKNKICNQLDLLGLLEDDYGMELLVAGNIISLDLSIAQVYEQVWKKSNQCSNVMTNSAMLPSNGATSSRDCPPMTVTYRLQGLDGEATEPMIKELEEDREETQDPEVEFAIAGAVREYGGLDIILTMIQRLHDDFKSNHEQLVAVLNLLMLCCKIRENRRALLRLGALGLLLETARRAFSVDAIEPAEGILLIVESLTLEANESDDISIAQSVLTVASEETGAREQAKKIVLMFLERLCHPSGFKKSNKQQRNTEMVARILPYLTYGEPAAMEALIQHFYPYLQDWSEFDRLQEQHQENPKDENISLQAAKQRFALENFVRVSESLKTSFCGERLKDIILDKAITSTAVRYLRESFGMVGKVGFKSGAKWASGLKLPSVPLILSMLKGLSVGHAATQRCIDEGGILPLLHALEGVAGENDIGARAENLLDTLCDGEGKGDGLMGEKVRMLRRATRHEMRRRALRKREELLQGLGMRQELASDGGERIVVAQPVLEGLEDVQEEEGGLACMVCREGYSLRPVDLLGVYTYSKRVNLGVGTSGSLRGECVYTTVSHFNIIHFQCHQEAKRADSALKNPKKEWEGATLRNNETLCNSLFPISGPAVPVAQYVRYVDQYWDNLNALGRADGNRLRLLIYDIVLMLARFATGASFSTDSKGGGRESNSRFLTFMIQMARHLLDHGGSSQRGAMAKAVSTYLTPCTPDSKPSTSWTHPSTGTEETVQFMMVNSLLSESYESWLQHRSRFLQRGIYHAYMQHTHGRSTLRASPVMSESASAGAETGDMLAVVQPMLVYTGLIQKMQHFFKVKKNGSAREGTAAAAKTEEEEGEGEESAGLEGWEVVMKGRVTDVGEMVGFSKELLSWLEDMNSASHLQEAFDIVGALPDVLSGGFARCEDFVRAAISMAKS